MQGLEKASGRKTALNKSVEAKIGFCLQLTMPAPRLFRLRCPGAVFFARHLQRCFVANLRMLERRGVMLQAHEAII
jgi:hypothetical protein